jgi:hypothetical protein
MGQVAHLRYVVERNTEAFEHDWSVTFGGEHFGHFHTQQEALDAALSDAERVARLGHDIEVRVHRRDGEESAVWTYDSGRQCMVQADAGGHRSGPEPDPAGEHAAG